VYDITDYSDDHPGGTEVLLDVAGQDADTFFEDIGHSLDARETLKKYLIGNLLMDEEEIERRKSLKAIPASGGSSNVTFLAIIGLIIAVAVYFFTQKA